MLNKIQGVAHGGGVQVAADSEEFAHTERLVRLLEKDDVAVTHFVGLFPSGSDALGRQGFARVVNRSGVDGEVHIDAYDDAGESYGPVTLALGAGETVHFNSNDLEAGNAAKGLEGSTGAGEGDWRLEFTSALELEVLAYIRTDDGFLTSMHDVVPRTETGHRVVTFNPGRNTNQVSRLRLINRGADSAEVRIEGIDDDGQSPGVAVALSVEGGASRTVSAQALESGEGVSGALGTGSGKWRLVVSADRPIEVMSLLSSPTGHLTNLSTAPGPARPIRRPRPKCSGRTSRRRWCSRGASTVTSRAEGRGIPGWYSRHRRIRSTRRSTSRRSSASSRRWTTGAQRRAEQDPGRCPRWRGCRWRRGRRTSRTWSGS